MRQDIDHKVNLLRDSLLQARTHDPFAYLGLHREGEEVRVRVFKPYSTRVWIYVGDISEQMTRTHSDGIFEWVAKVSPGEPYRLQSEERDRIEDCYDAYAFPSQISGYDLHLFNEGRLLKAHRVLGAHATNRQGVTGVRFAVWAPNAARVSVVGEFNRWDGRVHQMAIHGSSGVWELFIPAIKDGSIYKFEICNRQTGAVIVKTDPYAQQFEHRPSTAARINLASAYCWQDQEWVLKRTQCDWLHAPCNIYEVHVGSWRRHPDGRFYSYRDLAQHLIPYAKDMGYTHIELLPISEHPLDESWGYQTTGYFAATSRFGNPDDLRYFVDCCHQSGLGVFLDWVPGHFPQDSFALARFDGTALYEHEDPRLGMHEEWGTHVFNFGRNEVKSFLLSSASYWITEFHFDGLRVDAVASMLYLDYSRREGEWLPNKYGGRENIEATEFLRELNVMIHGEFPGVLTLAEESTSWPMVSRPTYLGGLGFSMKWNMGWMNDTLTYMAKDPIYRRYEHNQLTFGQLYAYTENFVLPLSHDEVVHGKGSLLDKMPGDTWQKFANLRLLFTYQITSPGKKLNFMGSEFAQGREWQERWELDWWLLTRRWHSAVQAAVRDLNRLYRDLPALHELDFEKQGFSWIDCHDADQSVISYVRYARDGTLAVVVLNFTPVPRSDYLIGVPAGGVYLEAFNSDSKFYGGSNKGNAGRRFATRSPWMGLSHSLQIELPPLAGVIFIPEKA